MNTKTLFFIGCLCAVVANAFATDDKTAYVDPFIGTGDHGHVFLGANVPFGFVQLGPVNLSKGWDWCSGYHISDSTIVGFAHTHLSGTGIGDLGDIALMPVVGDVKAGRDEMYSLFSHERETAKAGYYAVHLDRYNTDVELTATLRVGFHKYIFPPAEKTQIIFDLEQGIGWDRLSESRIFQENDTVISGYRYSKGWANNQRIYFSAVFSRPISAFRQENNRFGYAAVDTRSDRTVYVKVALSPVSIENAKLNMQAELPDWQFDRTVSAAQEAWNSELNKIDFQTQNPRDRRIFYTALYHTMVAPSVFCDVNGDYFGADKQIHRNADFVNYTTFSLWDTYRAAHPLMTLIHPEKMADIIQTMLHIYQQQGKLPVWHLVGNETDCMIGNPAIPVVADAILKGFRGFDTTAAYEAMKQSALLDERGQKWMKEYGYIPFDKENESLAKAMEYAIADWSLAQVAKQMNRPDDAKYFTWMSRTYQHYFDATTGFVRGKDSQGKFRTPFDPFRSEHRENDYTEGTAWQYTWLVPHDPAGLAKLFGGKKQMFQKLDSLFIVSGDMGENASPDISGLIGQYAHGNEPGHHTVYLYACLGEQHKTADRVRQILTTLYNDQPAGLCGNEDVGQMSAWYVLSALGFYQVEPAGGKYVFGSPLMDRAIIAVGNEKTFEIIVKNNSAANKYIQSVRLNGKRYRLPYLSYHDIAKGGVLEITMGSE
ncbi:MAG: GH92 family glycosyl hydrolase [Candidatus Symbiothrix sp.]|jgi:predicted alpha-1,2-mannosidase|nr:GH92 family glycosyl hydrolase [Candidatus Symbiothrix sp.]